MVTKEILGPVCFKDSVPIVVIKDHSGEMVATKWDRNRVAAPWMLDAILQDCGINELNESTPASIAIREHLNAIIGDGFTISELLIIAAAYAEGFNRAKA